VNYKLERVVAYFKIQPRTFAWRAEEKPEFFILSLCTSFSEEISIIIVALVMRAVYIHADTKWHTETVCPKRCCYLEERCFWGGGFHYRLKHSKYNLPLAPIVSQLNAIHAFTSCFFKLQLSSIFPSSRSV
jgi:hypothetical protein